jgi:hypothetical protein
MNYQDRLSNTSSRDDRTQDDGNEDGTTKNTSSCKGICPRTYTLDTFIIIVIMMMTTVFVPAHCLPGKNIWCIKNTYPEYISQE